MVANADKLDILSSSEALPRLFALARRAKENVPFYQTSLIAIDFSSPLLQLTDLPILTKATVRVAQETLVRSDYMKGRPDEFISYTSGSTGIPLRLIRTRAEIMRCARALWRARADCFPEVRDAFGVTLSPGIPSNRNPGFSEQRKRGEIVALSTLDWRIDNANEFLDKLDHLKPDWISGPPALLSLLGESLRRENRSLRTNLAFIESMNDWLSPETRSSLAEIFNCRVLNHYGCQETYTIAYECPKGNMHICDDCVVVELHPYKDTDEREIVVSSLVFEVMPFIRYKVGDFVKLEEKGCLCGKTTPLLGQVRGRTDEIIAGTSLLGNMIFLRVVAFLTQSSGSSQIKQYQVVQTAINDFEVKLVLHEHADVKKVGTQFHKIANFWLPEAKFSFQLVDHIHLPSSRKLQPFIKNL